MKRKLMMVERIMYVDAATPLNCIFTAKITGAINPANLHIALHKVQQKHPLLRACIDDTQKSGPIFVFNDYVRPIPIRITERRTDNDWLKESEKEWYRLFTSEDQPLAQIVWVRSATVSELLLVMPHCICDGTTCVALMREILSLLDDPDQELDAYLPFSSVQELMPADFNIAKNIRKSRIFSVLGKLYFLFKSTTVKVVPGENYVIHWKLDEEQTLAVAESCKAADVSVHAALCVAFMQAFKQVQGNKAKGKVISPVDIRRFIPQIRHDHMFAFAPIIELNLDKNNTTGFWDVTRNLKTELGTKIDSMNTHEMLWMGEFMHATVNKMIKVLKASDGSHDITLSNMGRISMPQNYNTFKLDTLYSPTLAFPWRNANTLVTTTFNNQMDFSLMSNNSFLDKADAVKIKDVAMKTLLAHLQQLTHA